mmetsp:Transcript_7666/g.9492  ORF Transcript_7666/g.9492 Transcript_7666/m.9492 type:complete len:291 (-) Transcript_7666:24-896(-)
MSDRTGEGNKKMALDQNIPEEEVKPDNGNNDVEVHSKFNANQADEESNKQQTEDNNEEAANGHENENDRFKTENDDSDPEFEQGYIDNAQDASSSNKDYAKLFEKYQERFYKVYSVSQRLFQNEISQRQTLNFYQRRNNALIDLLDKFESKESISPTTTQALPDADKSRIENLIAMNPKLQKVLAPLLTIDDPEQQFKETHKINLLISETIPDLINDDMGSFELNPQDIEPWVRRHYPNLVISKYKPLKISGNKFKETIDSVSTTATKRKRKLSKEDENDEDPQSKKPKT